MSSDAAQEALARLRELVIGTAVVDPAVFSRLARALVRTAGAEGEMLFGLQIVREPDPGRAERLVEISAEVLGPRAIGFLRTGASRWKGYSGRVLATAEALGQLGTPEAHQTLLAIERESPSAEVKRVAAARREAIEARHPARYRLLPALRLLEREGTDSEELAQRLLESEEQELVPLVLDAWGDLPAAARRVVLRAFEVRGDSLAGHTFQGMLETGEAGDLLLPFCRCLGGIVRRHPEAVQGYEGLWLRLWQENGDTADVAEAAACALTVAPSPDHVALYREFLRSEFEGARLAGLRALTAVPSPEARPEVMHCLSAWCEVEMAAALEALAALGEDAAIEEWAQCSDPSRRRGVAAVCLKALRSDVWLSLASDTDPTVATAALNSWDEAPPEARPGTRQVEPLLERSAIAPVFHRVCRILAAIGDAETVGVATAQLRREPWRRALAANALKALRIRRVFHWRDLPDETGKEILRVLEECDEREILSLLSALAEDLPQSALTRLGEVLRARAGRGGDSDGGEQAMVRAVLEKVQEAVGREKARGELDQLLGPREGPPPRMLTTVRRVSELWIHFGTALGEERSTQIERFLCSVAEDRTAGPVERVEAVVALGARAGAEAMRTVARLRGNPLDALSGASERALSAFARRRPDVNLASLASPGGPTVLVVSADRHAQGLYQRFLGGHGFHVLTAPDAPGAQRNLRGPDVNAVLLDLDLPDGADDVLRSVAALARRPTVIVLSGRTDQATILRFRDLGAGDVLRKPADLPALLDRISRATGFDAGKASAPSDPRLGPTPTP